MTKFGDRFRKLGKHIIARNESTCVGVRLWVGGERGKKKRRALAGCRQEMKEGKANTERGPRQSFNVGLWNERTILPIWEILQLSFCENIRTKMRIAQAVTATRQTRPADALIPTNSRKNLTIIQLYILSILNSIMSRLCGGKLGVSSFSIQNSIILNICLELKKSGHPTSDRTNGNDRAASPPASKTEGTQAPPPPPHPPQEDSIPTTDPEDRGHEPPTAKRHRGPPTPTSLHQSPSKFPFPEAFNFAGISSPPNCDKDRLFDLMTSSAALAAAAEFTKTQRRQQQMQREQLERLPSPPTMQHQQHQQDGDGDKGMSPTAMASVQAALAALQAGQMSLNQV
jgi:hypothetical protein